MKQTIIVEPINLLEKALLVLQDGICIIKKDTTIQYINSAAQHLLEKQFNRLPVIGNKLSDFTEPSDIHREFISKAFANEYSTFDVELSSGAWYEVGYYPMPDEDGYVKHVCIKGKDITNRVVLEKKLLQERKARKNKLIKATIEAQEKERSLIGRELHDNVNQVLTTVKLYNELCYQDDIPNKELLKRSVQQINYCIEEIRSLSRRLAVPKVGELGLEELIRELVNTLNTTKKASIEFRSFGIKGRGFTQELQTTIYRIIQEQLTNVMKYSFANTIKVIIAGTNNDIAVQVQDDGIGFDLKEKINGNGITNMISRAETIGGTLRFETSPGNGCSMTAEFPLDR